MAQNIYDNDEFFAGYARLPRSVAGLDGAPEWPALQAMLPDLRGRRVLDLGCGYGWFCRWVREQGAAQVLGIDLSDKMLARARADTHDPAIAYQQADMDRLELSRGAFDLVYSSLAFHYIEDLDRLLREVRGALMPSGSLVFSAEHPVYTAPIAPGWTVDAAGGKSWRLDHYLDEGRRLTDWLSKGVVKQHRMLGTYLDLLLRLGFGLTHIEEWGPSEAQVAAHPEWSDERHRPMFLLVAARRPPD